ncbi:MAG: DNA polymerase IV [Pseudomonadota bacterium]
MNEKTEPLRAIVHVDMDAFFASVEQRDRPELRGRPVIVGGSGQRGVVAAASYEVRRFGVRSAMPSAVAKKRCPHAVFVKGRHAHYREVSAEIFRIFHRYTDRVEGLSIDEAYLDVSERIEHAAEMLELGRSLKREISSEVGLSASVGMAGSKLVAKLASDYDKPDGLIWIPDHAVQRFLDPMPIRRLPGVGPSTAQKLHDAGILTIGQLRIAPLELLTPAFGNKARDYQLRAAGQDTRQVSSDRVRRSISQESTFDTELHDLDEVNECIVKMAEQCAERLNQSGLYARTVHLKLRSAGFSTLTRSRTLQGYTRDAGIISHNVIELAAAWARYQSRISVRLIGVGVSALAASVDVDQML